MALWTLDAAEPSVWNRGGDFLLLCKGEEAVAFDADYECGLFDLGEGYFHGVGGIWGDSVS